MTEASAPVETGITPRNLQFDFNEDLPLDWHSGDPAITHLYDALSLTFPEGEKFFVDSVRHYEDRITDPVLKARVRDFIQQEAIHAREHRSYNKTARPSWGRHVVCGLADETRCRRHAPYAGQVSIGGDLRGRASHGPLCRGHPFRPAHHERVAHPFYQDLWRWHAMEEEEHKSVAYDVYQTVSGGVGGYFLRIAAMLFVAQDILIGIPLMQNPPHAQAWAIVQLGVLAQRRAAYVGVPRYFGGVFAWVFWIITAQDFTPINGTVDRKLPSGGRSMWKPRSAKLSPTRSCLPRMGDGN